MARLQTLEVNDPDDVRRFFDGLADAYHDSHGDADALLRYRLGLIRSLLRGAGRSCLVEIGCGNGLHLFPLADEFDTAIGIDLSPKMIAVAESRRMAHPRGSRIRFATHAAERLSSVPDESASAVLCVGAFEHMLEPHRVLSEVRRVLEPGGAFVCLAPNGDYVWYTQLAPRLGLHTRHLSTDRFMSRAEWRARLLGAELQLVALGAWRFVPAGDMPRWAAATMRFLDRVGQLFGLSGFRGGTYVKAVKARGAPPAGRSDAR